MNSKKCTKTEGYMIIAIAISSQLLTTLSCHTLEASERGIPALTVNCLASVSVSKH